MIDAIADGGGIKILYAPKIHPPPINIFTHSVSIIYLSIIMALRLEHFIIRHRPNISRYLAKNIVALKRMMNQGYQLWFDPEVLVVFF